jgi:hypothetical protein
MMYPKTMKYLSLLFGLTLIAGAAMAGIQVIPNYLFLDASHRTLPFSVINDGSDEREVWLETRFGYETSDYTGKIFIYIDSLALNEPSAAGWIQGYPRRFLLKPGESQTVRLVVTPPAGLFDGEYWSRILIMSKSRTAPTKVTETVVVKPGIVLLFQQSIPFHYRVGKLSTGLTVDSLTASISDTTLDVTTKLSRTGNAAFWGSRVIRVFDKSGKVVFSLKKNAGVYKTLTLVDHISKTGLSSGEYNISVEFLSEGRTDVPKQDLIHSDPVRASTTVVMP